ncbi:MAG: hypothetical protein H0T73_09355 [Ardenticatenales bacterium]|nr:hypothetical protein [Ardenticatenales bacterium]
MAAYETQTSLSMVDAIARAREFFELKQGLVVKDRLGVLIRWRGESEDTIELRAFPVKGGGTRLEIDTLHSDELVLAFIRELPRPGLLDNLRRLWGK